MLYIVFDTIHKNCVFKKNNIYIYFLNKLITAVNNIRP